MPSQSSIKTRILVVEDYHDLQTEMIDFLELSGHLAEGADDLAGMYKKLQQSHRKIVLLDLGLPDGDGIEHIANLRRCYGLHLGIIIVSARGSDEERIIGLKNGADAYLVKPLNLHELNLLIIRLSARIADQQLSDHTWILQTATKTLLTPAYIPITLTGTEYLLLEYLAYNSAIHERVHLCEILYSEKEFINVRKLDTLICRLRHKTKNETGFELPISSFRNKGYGFTANIKMT